MLLLIFFLMACGVGAVAAWRAKPSQAEMLTGAVLILCSALLGGALTVAAEAGSAAARYLGLAAVVLCSAAFSSAGVAAARINAARRNDSGS